MTTKIKTSNIDQTTLETIGGGPKIANVQIANSSYGIVDDTAISLSGGFIVINGTGFDNGCQVVVGSSPATAVTFVSDSELRVQTPGLSQGTYIVQVINPDGANAVRFAGLNYSASPSWLTSSSLANATINTSFSYQLQANGDSAILYSLNQGSSLPPNTSLASNGLLTGLVSNITSNTTYNFTVIANDQENQDSSRAFTLIVNALVPLSNVQQITTRNTFYVSEPVLNGTSGRITFAGSKPQNWGHVFCGVTTLTQSSFRSASANSTINSVDTNHTIDSQGVIWYLDFDDYAVYEPDLVRAHNPYTYQGYSAASTFAFGWSRSGLDVTVTAINPSSNSVIYTRTASVSNGTTPRIILAGVAAEYGNYNVDVVSQTSPTLFFNPN